VNFLPSNVLKLLLCLQLGLGNKCPGLQLAALIARFLMFVKLNNNNKSGGRRTSTKIQQKEKEKERKKRRIKIK